jgi:polysaccharide pyruvyl transferase WcaK-like protein
MQKSSVIFGYYNKDNYGDDVFEYVLEKYITPGLVIKNIDELKCTDLTKYDKVLVGCGDVVNEYFLSPENLDILSKCKAPVIFIGIGIQYIDYIYSLDVGDYYLMRNKTDCNLLRDRYPGNVAYIPDLAHFLSSQVVYKAKRQTEALKIGICIPYPWIAQNDSRARMFYGKIVSLVKDLQISHNVVYIPFDTSNTVKNSDLVLGKMLKESTGIESIVNPSKDIQGMLDIFSSMDLIIASRFHSVILSIVTRTPFISLFTSEKILKLKRDLPASVHSCFFKLEQLDGEPINIPISEITDMICKLSDPVHYQNAQDKITNTCQNFDILLDETRDTIIELMSAPAMSIVRNSPPRYISQVERRSILNAVIKAVLSAVGKHNIQNVNALTKFGNLANFIPKTTSSRNEALKKRLSEEILWIVTGDPYAPYYYGLFENLFTGSFIDKINWMITDYYANYYYDVGQGVQIVNRNFQNIHRSGWQYVVNNIKYDSEEPLIIDTYVDKTFHWNRDFYTSKAVIPYKSPWVGVIHHTFSDYTNSYNCDVLLRNESFLQSLPFCKTLVVMSEYLASQIRERLGDVHNVHNVQNVHITVLTHPTENPQLKFRWDLFEANMNKRLVNIGSWLRNMFTIYTIMLPDESWVNEKCILKNKNSDSYFAPPDLFDRLDTEHTPGCLDMCRTSFENMHVKGLYEWVYKAEHSVTLLEYLPNDEYDALLTSNVVFVDYVDASATNTLVECIVRNTPIIVNKIPAVVEILGEDYPLYYTTPYSILKLLEKDSLHLVRKAYDFLCDMDKTKFSIDYFSQEFNKALARDYPKCAF